VVILDITGMKHVDTQVVGSLMNTAAALRLLGAHAVLTGIRPEVAHTMVELGVDLTGLVTKSTLRSGIAYALERSHETGLLAGKSRSSSRR
jgi:anti-anti-sigma regulatory factor